MTTGFIDSGHLYEVADSIVGHLTGVDATAVAISDILVVEPGKQLIVTKVVIHLESFTDGGKAQQAIASFGGNAATYDDYLNTVTYTFTTEDYAIIDSVRDSEYPVYAAGTSFRVSIETGSDATTEDWDIYVFGFYITT